MDLDLDLDLDYEYSIIRYTWYCQYILIGEVH
jgi:hypothetical protein